MSKLDMVVDAVVDRSAVPDTMARAITFMLAGAALTLVEGVFTLLREVHRPTVAMTSFAISVFAAAIWWLVARACQRGRAVGRVWASIFFGMSTTGVLAVVADQHAGVIVTAVDILGWLIGLGAIAMLWTRTSGDYLHSGRDLS